MNGMFTINTDLPVQRSQSAHLSGAALRSASPGPVDFLMKGHFIGLFAQDKWKLSNNLTINYGARYDIEILPTPNQDNPLFDGRSGRLSEGPEQHLAARSASRGRSTSRAARRCAAASASSTSARRTRS